MASRKRSNSFKFAIIFVALIILAIGIYFIFFGEGSFCNDNDGGQNYGARGTVTCGKEIPVTWTDYCAVKENVLVEYVIVNNQGEKDPYECPYGCKDGACIPEGEYREKGECIDSDGGLNYNVKGIVTCGDYHITWEDKCLDDHQWLAEYTASEEGGVKETYICPNLCRDGACI